MAKKLHLTGQHEFVASFATFALELTGADVKISDENTIRLFDMWLANTKDERFLAMQKAQIEDNDEPWKKGRGYDD